MPFVFFALAVLIVTIMLIYAMDMLTLDRPIVQLLKALILIVGAVAVAHRGGLF